MPDVRTRFAPSPTGYLHIGGVRTALFNYLYAKKNNGQFLLRLEDTDQERFVEEGVEHIVAALDWLGLKPDEGFWITEGKHQNIEFVQSERQARGYYQKKVEQLIEAGLAYYSPTSKDSLEQMREQAKKAKQPFIYRKRMDSKNASQTIKNSPIRLDIEAFFKTKAARGRFFEEDSRGWSVRWSEPHGRDMAAWNWHHIDDFILIKADGFPTYNFANVVDDHDMNISHVMRGDEFIASTPKYIILYHALGIEQSMPEFIHLPVINGADGKKLSKRSGDTDVLEYARKGYQPKALLNFLALLGWNDGSNQEIFTLDELKQKFQIKNIHTSPAVFDQRRLDWISGHHIRSTKLSTLYDQSKNFWGEPAKSYSQDYKKTVLSLIQDRLKYLAELPKLTDFFFRDLDVNPELITSHKQLKKQGKATLKDLLKQTLDELEKSNFTVDDLTNKLNKLLERTGQKPVVLFSLIRIATTQAVASPGLAETMSVLGKQTCLKRINQQIDAL